MSEPNFAFNKKIGINESMYGDIDFYINCIEKLLICMKETNKLHGINCEFFRLDFRPPTFDGDEFPFGSLVLDMKWGSKKELESKKDSETYKISEEEFFKGPITRATKEEFDKECGR